MKTRNRSAALPALSATALSVAIVLLALALPAAAVAAPSWLTPVDLSAGGQPAYDPQVAVDGDGNATAVWTRNNDSNNRIVQSAVRPAGGSWSAPVDVSIPGRNADAPQVAVDRQGNATAVWCRFESDSNVVQSAERAPGGSWSTPVTLSAPGMRAEGRDVYCPAQVAVDEQGNATAVWDRTEGGQHFVQSAVRARGGSWSAPVDVSVPGPEAGDPQVAVDGQGNATAVWRRNNGSTYIVQSAVRPLGGSWSAPADLSSPSGFLGDKQQVAVDRQGNATAVWVVKPSLAANFVVQSAVRMPGGSWSAPIDISTVGGQFPSNPQVAVDGQGNATAVWERLDGASNSIVQSAVRAPGGSWSAPADLSAAGQDAADPQVAVDGQGNATAVWSRFDGSLVRVQGAVRATSGVWSAPADLSAAGHEGDYQQVAVDEKGNATVVWQRDEQDVEDPLFKPPAWMRPAHCCGSSRFPPQAPSASRSRSVSRRLMCGQHWGPRPGTTATAQPHPA